MEFNFTIFVQMGNFLVTYLFLNRYLFGPALASITHKKEREASLLESIKHEQEELKNELKAKTDLVHAFAKKVHTSYSLPPKQPLEIDIAVTDTQNPQEVAKETEAVKDLIIERTLRVD